MSDKELTTDEKLEYFYKMALDQENDPAMVTAMMGAVALKTITLVHGANGEPCFNITTKGIEQAEQLKRTPAGREIIAQLNRAQIHRS